MEYIRRPIVEMENEQNQALAPRTSICVIEEEGEVVVVEEEEEEVVVEEEEKEEEEEEEKHISTLLNAKRRLHIQSV